MFMQGFLVVLVIVAAVASRLIEARLWRAGRLSNRATATLLLGTFPVVCLLFGLILGVSVPLLLGITALALVPTALFYCFTLDLLREQMPQSG
jgi:hypothetical protein